MNKTILAVAVVASISVGATTVFADTKQAAIHEVALGQIGDAFAGVETIPITIEDAKILAGTGIVLATMNIPNYPSTRTTSSRTRVTVATSNSTRITTSSRTSSTRTPSPVSMRLRNGTFSTLSLSR